MDSTDEKKQDHYMISLHLYQCFVIKIHQCFKVIFLTLRKLGYQFFLGLILVLLHDVIIQGFFKSILQLKFIERYVIIQIIVLMQPQQVDFYVPKQPYLHQKIKKISIDSQAQNKNLGKSIIITGFPYDEGTKRNGGRVGGAIGSTIFRNRLQETTFYLHKDVQLYDSGDINNQLQLEDAHIKAYQKNLNILLNNKQALLFSIGGSNDQSYPNVRALLQTYPQSRIGVINLDAHFDVRPLKQGKAHSGSPFRQMLENEIFFKNGSEFIQFACKGATCSNEHYKYLKQKNASVYWLEKNIRTFEKSKQSIYTTQAGQLFEKIVNQMAAKVDYIFISFDTDSINSKYMPGVSAPSVVGGLTSAQAIEIMKITGLQKKVRLVDFSEFNPAVESLISSTMLAEMFYALVTAFAERIQKQSLNQ